MKTYTENDIFPSHCWFADWQPRTDWGKLLIGEVLIRRRDEASTTSMIVIPVGERGITKDKAKKLTAILLEELSKGD